jgi:hypothetical protein
VLLEVGGVDACWARYGPRGPAVGSVAGAEVWASPARRCWHRQHVLAAVCGGWPATASDRRGCRGGLVLLASGSWCAQRLQLPSRCSGQLVGAAPPACGCWRPVCFSGDDVPAEEEDAGAAAPGVRAFSSLLRRERVWREATRREVLRLKGRDVA